MSEKILVTGGTGYIGSHTVVELITQGFEPIILDNLSNSHEGILDAIQDITGVKPAFYKGDCRDAAIYDKIFSSHQISSVIHFAAFKAVGESVHKPLAYFDNNINGLNQLLIAMDKFSIRNLVFSSSCTVYGDPDDPVVTEETPLKDPQSPYGFTKLAGEKMLENVVRHKKQMRVALLRYFNPIGAHPSGKIGELPQGTPNNLLPYITQTAMGIREKLAVFGNDYATSDGSCIRDYIHVCDVASAHVSAITMMHKKEEAFIDAINIGTGKGTSVLEIIRIFEEVNAIEVNWEFAPRREGDVPEIFAKVDKAEHVLNWSAKFSVRDAVKDAWEWEKKYRKQ